MDDVNLFKKFGKKQVLTIIKQALKDGKSFGLDKTFNVINVTIKNNAILVYYKSDINNRFAIYNDFALIIGFIHSFLVGEFSLHLFGSNGVRKAYCCRRNRRYF